MGFSSGAKRNPNNDDNKEVMMKRASNCAAPNLMPIVAM